MIVDLKDIKLLIKDADLSKTVKLTYEEDDYDVIYFKYFDTKGNQLSLYYTIQSDLLPSLFSIDYKSNTNDITEIILNEQLNMSTNIFYNAHVEMDSDIVFGKYIVDMKKENFETVEAVEAVEA